MSSLFGPGRPVAATVGTLDGMHLGHQAVLRRVVERARSISGISVLVTFHPHPLSVARPEIAPPLLTSRREKVELLAQTELDHVLIKEFTPALRRYSPERFAHEVLAGEVGVRELVVGYDHGFGKGRTGDVRTLRRMGAQMGFGVEVVEALGDAGALYSSTKARRALLAGRVVDAKRYLGRSYALSGVVVRGKKRGRTLGFPTANLRVLGENKLVPGDGVYAGRIVAGGPATSGAGAWPAAVHIGPRPAVGDMDRAVEAYLLDFAGDLYGETLTVEFDAFLRPVVSFAAVSEMVRAMEEDVRSVAVLFGAPQREAQNEVRGAGSGSGAGSRSRDQGLGSPARLQVG